MNFIKSNTIFLSVLMFLIIVRFYLSSMGIHNDLLATAGWGEWIYKHGTVSYYTNNSWIYSWPTQPPLINLIYGFNYYLFNNQLFWLFSYISAVIHFHGFFPQYFAWLDNFVKWFGTSLAADSPFPNGFLVSMKLIPVTADIVIALTIYVLGKKIKSKKVPVVTLLYLILPFSWYVSSFWGQYDQLSSLVLLVSLLLIFRRQFILSSVLFFIAGEIKPTTVTFFPFYIFYFLFQKPNLKQMLTSIGALALAFWVITKPFTNTDPFLYFINVIYPKVFNSDRYGLVNHAFNFWQLLSPFGGWSTTFYLLKIPALIWGFLFLIIFNIWGSVVLIKEKGIKGLIMAAYLISAGSYLFVTGMVDRYFFAALVFMAILIFYFPQVLKIWILSAIVFSVNLFYSWGFPLLTDLQAWKNPFIIQIFSLIQLLLFFFALREMAYLIYLKEFWKKVISLKLRPL